MRCFLSICLFTGSRCWLPSTTRRVPHRHRGPDSFATPPQCLATCLINGTETTLWEIRVMKSDSSVHADPLHLVYFSRRWGARLRSEKATHILILVGGNLLDTLRESEKKCIWLPPGWMCKKKKKKTHQHWLMWRA